jgi:hypothetical protein
MGFVAGLFDGSPNDEAVFWQTWNTMPRRERRTFLKRLGRERGRLLNETDARQQLAGFVKESVFSKTTDRGPRRPRGPRGIRGKRGR